MHSIYQYSMYSVFINSIKFNDRFHNISSPEDDAEQRNLLMSKLCVSLYDLCEPNRE